MFICHDCVKNKNVFYVIPLSRGPCEECKKTTTCVDVPPHYFEDKKIKVTIDSATIVQFEDKK